MEDIPPSYHQSMNPSVLDLIAPYLDTPSLHTLTLVSRTYNEVFMPHLWGSPASHFVPLAEPTQLGLSNGTQINASYDDMVYVALTRFKRVLKKARLLTRCLVHTLYLPPAVSEIYGGPNATWLKEVLDGLPNLQSLCVGGLPFFDHHSLAVVDKRRQSVPSETFQTYPLKLLLASKEPNATSIGLSLFLPHVASLIYLDLSYTTPAKDINVLSSLYTLHDLQVLKLRGIGLRDAEAEVLARAIGLRVRLLDIAENLLSDATVRNLLEHCFVHTKRQGESQQIDSNRSGYHDHNPSRQLESWPVGLPPAPDYLSLDTLRSSDFDKNLLVQLTNPLTGRLAFEDIPHGGLTHLYITGNQAVTVEGIRSLLEIGRLHVLDAGEVAGETAVDKYIKSAIETGRSVQRPRSTTSGSRSIVSTIDVLDNGHKQENEIHVPGAEKLIPALREKASKNLTYLRIDHAIVTKTIEVTKHSVEVYGCVPAQKTIPEYAVELNGRPGDAQIVEAPGSYHQAVELPTDQVFELDATPINRVELPGDPIHFALTPPMGDKPVDTAIDEVVKSPIRGEGAYAPEVAVKNGIEKEETAVLNATGSSMKKRSNSPSPSTLPKITTTSQTTNLGNVLVSQKTPETTSMAAARDRQATIDALVKERTKESSSKLHPSSIANMRTLVLTNIPSQVLSTSPILISLKDFITACSSEAYLASLRAKTNYSLPPGRARVAAEREHARSLFALQTIVLEIVPASPSKEPQRRWKHTRQRLSNQYKSSTGDRDSEALWSAAENDFSFFGEEGEEHEECGIYEHEPGKYFPSVMVDDKFAVLEDTSSPASGSTWAGGGGGGSNSYSDNDTLSLSSPSMLGSTTGTIFRSPRELPLGRNRRSSNEAYHHHRSSFSSHEPPPRSVPAEMSGSFPVFSPSARSIPPTTTGTVSTMPAPPPPTSNPINSNEKDESVVTLDLVSELSKFRKERKSQYENAVRRLQPSNNHQQSPSQSQSTSLPDSTEVFVAGHWKGEIKVIRNNTGAPVVGRSGNTGGTQARLERNGMVDVYGNYFEKGYLYS